VPRDEELKLMQQSFGPNLCPVYSKFCDSVIYFEKAKKCSTKLQARAGLQHFLETI
jgi:hypothetical protein